LKQGKDEGLEYTATLKHNLQSLEKSMKQKEQFLNTKEKDINKIMDQLKQAFNLSGDLDLSEIRVSIDKIKHNQKL